MGNTCSPNNDPKGSEKAEVSNTDIKAVEEEIAQSGDNAQPGEKFTQIINTYQAETERLKKEIDELKTAETERAATYQEKTDERDALSQELEQMRAMLEAQKSAGLVNKLETALHKRATAMMSAEKGTQKLISAMLEKFGRAGRGNAKTKYVEVTLHAGEHTVSGFTPGMIRLTYADSEQAAQRTTGRVIKVKDASVSKAYENRTFSVTAQVEGDDKELVFACKDEKERQTWVDAFTKGFADIEAEVDDMKKEFQLKLEFNKDKLGIRVEEKILPETPEEETKAEDLPPPAEEPAADAAAPAAEDKAEGEKAEGETVEADIPAPAAEPAAPAVDDQKDPPCTLVVTAISDDDLKAKGLVEQMTLVSLDDITLDGKPYPDQLKLLTETKKPFVITFSGPKYLKKATVGATAYPEILKQLIAEDTNDTQKAFNGIIAGTAFEKELKASDNKNQLIKDLLGNQRQLTALLQSVTIQTADL